MSIRKRYTSVDRNQKGLIQEIRKYMDSHFHKHFWECHKSGGEDGDLGQEVAELQIYKLPSGGQCQLYVVMIDNTNGYGELISVLISAEDTEETGRLIEFLDTHGFVTNHSRLQTRPGGYQSYGNYLDDWYCPRSSEPFNRG